MHFSHRKLATELDYGNIIPLSWSGGYLFFSPIIVSDWNLYPYLKE